MRPCITLVALSLLVGLSLPASSLAQNAAPGAKTADTKKEEPQKDPKTVEYEKAVKDLDRIVGPFTFYTRKKDLLLELPEDKLGKIFLIQAAFNTGLDSAFMHAGMPVGGNAVDAFRFDRNEDSVYLVRPVISAKWSQDDPFAIGAERQFQEAILGSFHIEQENPEKKLLLINVTPLFFGEIFHLPELVATGLGGAYMMDREKSSVDHVTGFPENTIVQMKLHFFSPRGAESNGLLALLGIGGTNTLEDDRSAPLKVTYNLSYRKDDGYVPRFADPRVGYFTEDFFSLDQYLNTDRTERYIDRWNLVKKDPTAKLSEPVKPIVFTIDPSIPKEYRDAVKQGVLHWNKAFEALGYKNAVQAQDVPADEAHYDHADGRYNVIRMITTPSCPFGAISLFRTDPYTGEILNTSITLDGNLVRDLMQEHAHYLEQDIPATGNALKALMRDKERTETDDQLLFSTPEDRARRQLFGRMAKFGWAGDDCDYASELGGYAALSWDAVQLSGGKISREAYVKSFLTDCVSHEVGHCLGLRHNFAASTNLTTAQLADDSLTSKEGIAASVMDYTPPNVQAILRGSGNFYASTIGPYDVWAIKYGYMDAGSKTPIGERFALSQVASQSGLPGHAYMTDEDADNWDPLAVRFDCAKDPLAYSSKELEALQRAREYAIRYLPKPGESYAQRTAIIVNSITRSFREARNAARFVGGVLASRTYKGDADFKAPLVPVDSATQRQAMHLIAAHFFAPAAFDLPPSVTETLTNTDQGGGWDAPLRQLLGAYQTNLLALLMSASTTDRIAENSYKAEGKNSYDLDEHYGAILGSVFAEIGTNKPIKPLRRDLQRFAVNALITQAGAPPGAINEDVRMIAADSLRRLEHRCNGELKGASKLDELSKVHLRDTSDSIKRFLDRTVSTNR